MQHQKGVDAKNLLPIHAGQVHFSRIPVEYWQHRILMIKGLGLNALSIYIIWNYHEISPGKFDFSTGNKNLPLFLQLAQKHNMMVLFRPGPYVCAQWDFGGLPARLLNVPDLQIRSNNKQFLSQTKTYFEALVPIIRKHLKTQSNKKGCIVMLQIQNQYGFYGTDKSYMQQIRKMWHDLDVYITQYYVDWIQNIHKCHWKGANIGINDWSTKQQQQVVRSFQKEGFLLGGQIYSGWMTHWTEKWGGKSTKKVLKDYQFLLGNNHSFAMYVVHGGTNFGLTAGANGLKDKAADYWGAITSYDYDAPINQQGAPTSKYHQIRNFFKKYIPNQIGQIPPLIPSITIPGFKLNQISKLFSNLPHDKVENEKPLLFETNQLQMYNQGIVLYSTTLQQDSPYYLHLIVHDFGVLYLGNKLIKSLDRTKSTRHQVLITKQMIKQHGTNLHILIQASGHINFGSNMLTDKKGLYWIEGIHEKKKWTMHRFPIQYTLFKNWKQNSNQNKVIQNQPSVYIGNYQIEKVGDTYLDLSAYGKGYVWINGHNLGRYWNAGPQKRLFCPGAWMKPGKNQVMVFNILGTAGSDIQGVQQLYDTPVIYDEDE